MSLEDLSATNRNLRLQVEELRENVASLDSENQKFLHEKEYIKKQHSSFREAVDNLKSTMEHRQKTVEDIRERLDQANTVIQELALQNKSLVKANEELNQEIHEVTSQVAFLKHDKPAQEDNLEEIRNLPSEVQKYLRNLEDKLAKMQHSYHVERIHSKQLKEKVTNLHTARENRGKHIKELQNQQDLCVKQAAFAQLHQEKQVPAGILRHELVEARLVGDRSKERKVLH